VYAREIAVYNIFNINFLNKIINIIREDNTGENSNYIYYCKDTTLLFYIILHCSYLI